MMDPGPGTVGGRGRGELRRAWLSGLAVGLLVAGVAVGLVLGPTAYEAYTISHRAISSSVIQLPCPSPSAADCARNANGSTWFIGPPSSWCTPLARPSPGTNNSSGTSGGGWYCDPTVWVVIVNATTPVGIHGQLRVDGPFQVWVFGAVGLCEFEGTVARAAWSCAPPVEPGPAGTWNASWSAGATIDLAAIGFDVGAGAGLLPVGVWSVVVLDVSSGPETVTTLGPVTIGP